MTFVAYKQFSITLPTDHYTAHISLYDIHDNNRICYHLQVLYEGHHYGSMLYLEHNNYDVFVREFQNLMISQLVFNYSEELQQVKIFFDMFNKTYTLYAKRRNNTIQNPQDTYF